MDTIALDAAAAHVGRRVRFVAAVQQVASGKRVLVARRRVQLCHVLLVGDASRQFFKLTSWGEGPPTLTQALRTADVDGDADPMRLSSADAAVQVGDIVLFSCCRIKAYRGNVEAQFVQHSHEAATSSTAQLLYRKDRYFSVQDVPLKDLYPMIEWYKQHCREFIGDGVATSAARGVRNRAMIKDLRENMVASVLCKLRPLKDPAGGTGGGAGVASEMDGVLLCELVMYDSARDAMTVNLWDQHAEKRFVTRLLDHRGVIEIGGIVVSLQALSNRLLANTTPHTSFRLLDVDDPESIALERRITGAGAPIQITVAKRANTLSTFATIEELEASQFEGHATLQNVRFEQVHLGRHFGNESTVLAKFAPRLAERYCTGCNQGLPEMPCQGKSVMPRYIPCANKCKTRRGSSIDSPCDWRYRRCTMIIRDTRNGRLLIEVDNQAIIQIVGNIEARDLIESCETKAPATSMPSVQFHASSAVASLLNALVEESTQMFEAQLMCSTVKRPDTASLPSDSYQDSSHGEISVPRRSFNLISLAPSDVFSI
ncbi:unnamed protein product [Phytophthora fragariaefolia]|uniref:Unnamed protein product n=1 Tax=Phytophthora fragariaefolia TaxID=1490495 RepID=A0A9W6WVJ4_9STRA|nr:unnamed protein product [Phytophthora fragariaefolia]